MESTIPRSILILALALLAVLIGLLSAEGSTFMRLGIVLLPVLLVVGLQILRAPQILGLLIIPVIYSNIEGVIGIFTGLQSAVFVFLLTLVVYGLCLINGQLRFNLGRPAKLFLLFFAVTVPIAAVMPGRNDAAFQEWIKVLVYGLDAFLLTHLVLQNTRRLELLVRILTWTGVILSLINIVEFMDRSLINISQVPGRSAGLHLNSNPSAAAILACYIISYMAAQRFELLIRLVMFAGMYTTLSRATLLFFFAFLIYHEMIIQKLTIRRLLVSLLMVMSVALFLSNRALLIDISRNENVQKADSRLSAISEGHLDDASAKQRRRALVVQFENFSSHPILGGGAGAARGQDSPHNQFLLILVENGVVGLLLFLLFLAALLRRIVAMPRGSPRNTLLSLFFFEILNMFVLHNHFDHRFFVVVFALLCIGPELYDPRVVVSRPVEPSWKVPLSPRRGRRGAPAAPVTMAVLPAGSSPLSDSDASGGHEDLPSRAV